MIRETPSRPTIKTGIEARRRREARVRTAIPEERRRRILILSRSGRTESVAITNIARSATRAFCCGRLTGKHFVILDSLLAIADGILSIDMREDDHEDCEHQRLGSSSRRHDDDGIAICTSVYQTRVMDLEKGGPVCPQQRSKIMGQMRLSGPYFFSCGRPLASILSPAQREQGSSSMPSGLAFLTRGLFEIMTRGFCYG